MRSRLGMSLRLRLPAVEPARFWRHIGHIQRALNSELERLQHLLDGACKLTSAWEPWRMCSCTRAHSPGSALMTRSQSSFDTAKPRRLNTCVSRVSACRRTSAQPREAPFDSTSSSCTSSGLCHVRCCGRRKGLHGSARIALKQAKTLSAVGQLTCSCVALSCEGRNAPRSRPPALRSSDVSNMPLTG